MHVPVSIALFCLSVWSALAIIAAPATAQENPLCADPSSVCADNLPETCLERVGAGSIAIPNNATPSPDCDAAFTAYRACLTNFAETCGEVGATRPRSSGAIELSTGGALSTFQDCDQCPTMVVLEAGRFLMGSTSKYAYRNERPIRAVETPRFAISDTEITYAQWDVCALDGGCGGYVPSDSGKGRGDHPAAEVSLEDAQLYVDWLNSKVEGAPYRLPTEAEWEYAARAGTTTEFSWGDTLSRDRALYRWNTRMEGDRDRSIVRASVAVRTFSPNGWGLYGMHGNVSEWVIDCYERNYEDAPNTANAVGGPLCKRQVKRGGSWKSDARSLRSSARQFASRPRSGRPMRYSDVGFRVVSSP
ncbi:MAG: formylglycine-generating enzyme family protein [Rhodobacteraceae bacterium]|nr:formylglycine-generating enzyme family protein [Paracoccaceae bacterium]